MKCVKCGNDITYKDLYCPVCGTINLKNKENKIIDNMANNKDYQYDEENTFIKKIIRKLDNCKALFIIINIILFLVSFPLFKYGFDIGDRYNLLLLVFTLLFDTYVLSLEIILKKAGLSWWGIFIPLYNFYLLFKLIFGNGYLFIISIIPLLVFWYAYDFLSFIPPLVDITTFLELGSMAAIVIEFMVIFFMIGKRFGRSGIITMLFSFVIIPSIAFNKKYTYDNYYISNSYLD